MRAKGQGLDFNQRLPADPPVFFLLNYLDLHIILSSPLSVNVVTSTLTLWAIIERSVRPILLVSRRQFPRLLDFDFDYIAAWPHIVVEVVHTHTIYRLRVDTIPYRY